MFQQQTLEEKLKDSILEEKSAKVESTREDMLEFFKNGSVSNDVYKVSCFHCFKMETVVSVVLNFFKAVRSEMLKSKFFAH